ncbi:MAG: FG-GAP-like repeat-containing protein, partial [Muribaculaceae bacterium]|nr:FG-GAP-like repeat-containing protein [Muribaculaceae bacterium]
MKNLRLLLCLIVLSLGHYSAYSENPDNEAETLSTDGIGVRDSSLIPFDPSHYPDELTLKVDPENPGIPDVSSDYSVGSINGGLTVGPTGAAEYSIAIDCPNGGNLTPTIGLSYSSQNSDYGLAGYGFTISGLSAITHCEKTLFNNNGSIAGVNYSASDNLYLDGKRMILVSGSPFKEGAEYCLEGDPYTKIIAHGSYTDAAATTWFEVQTPDGLTYQYGKNSDSRVAYKNKSGKARIASWYVNRIEDVYSNYTTYTYTVQNNYVYPTYILYGSNTKASRGLNGRIEFEYAPYGTNAKVFRIEDQTGCIDRYLNRIITSLNGNVFRKYTLTYNHNSDLTNRKFSRLVEITEENGAGEKLTPTKFTWSFLPAGTPSASTLKIATTDALNNIVKEEDRNFMAADLNGDGVSDIIRVSPVTINAALTSYQTRVYISRSNVLSSGKVEYLSPLVYELPSSNAYKDSKYIIGGTQLMDYDGDGYNDILVPYYNYDTGINNKVSMKIIRGSSVVAGNVSNVGTVSLTLKNAKELPLMATTDVDKDGRDEIIYVEKTSGTTGYVGGIMHDTDDPTQNQEFLVRLDNAPEKMFCGDYNNDGLVDIILLHKDGYKIYFNNGGSESSAKFSEQNSKTGTTLADQWRVQQGDFDGDGLMDFVYYKSDNQCLWIARNNGDGTFTTVKTEDIGISESSTDKDDDKFTLLVYDFDGDGRSDVYVCKSIYTSILYTYTKSVWLYSDGATLKPRSSIVKKREDDAKEGTIFFGDFNGDGQIELANYGSRLTSGDDNSFEDGRLYIYGNSSFTARSGRIVAVTDGLGNKNSIDYAYLTDPRVYSRTKSSSYPQNYYTLPIAVVKSVECTNGVAGSQ